MPPSPSKPPTPKTEPDSTDAESDAEQKWGRVLIAGGIDWSVIGRKSTKGGKASTTSDGAATDDLESPHILRSLSNVRVVSIHSAPTASHFVCIDIEGGAWLFGRNEASNLGSTSASGAGGAKEGFVLATCPRYLTPERLGHDGDPTARFTSAIVGRSFTLLITSDGALYAAGDNKHGQLGLPPKVKLGLAGFTRVESCRHLSVVSGSAGGNFTLLVTSEGGVYALGSSEHGQTGTGRTGECLVKAQTVQFDLLDEPIRIGGALSGRKVVQVACGTAHSIALDNEGLVYTWGYNGYCRLGLGDQKDRLAPVAVGQFAKANAQLRVKSISCGPASTTVVDRMGIYYIAGRWKTTGDGGGGSPYTTFKYLQEMGACNVFKTASGGAGHFALADDHKDKSLTLAIAFGQGTVHSELGLGDGQPKAATKPTKVEPLDGLSLIDIAAGQGTTLYLCRPSDTYAELPRHEPLETADECFVCQQVDDQPGLVCDFCEKPFHLACLTPALDSQPEEPEWFCPDHEIPQDLQSLEFVHESELAAVVSKGKGKAKVVKATPGKGKATAPAKGRGKRPAATEPTTGKSKKRK